MAALEDGREGGGGAVEMNEDGVDAGAAAGARVADDDGQLQPRADGRGGLGERKVWHGRKRRARRATGWRDRDSGRRARL